MVCERESAEESEKNLSMNSISGEYLLQFIDREEKGEQLKICFNEDDDLNRWSRLFIHFR